MNHTTLDDDALHDNLYGYTPSLAAVSLVRFISFNLWQLLIFFFFFPSISYTTKQGIIFLILFTISTILHIIQGFRGQYKWMQVVAIGGLSKFFFFSLF